MNEAVILGCNLITIAACSYTAWTYWRVERKARDDARAFIVRHEAMMRRIEAQHDLDEQRYKAEWARFGVDYKPRAFRKSTCEQIRAARDGEWE
jgi:hypothetical protein